MTDYGYAAQILNNSARGAMGDSDSTGELWVLKRFSRVLALALGKKPWKWKQLQPGVPFDEVIDRVKQAQSENRTEKRQVWRLRSTDGDLGVTDPVDPRSDEKAH